MSLDEDFLRKFKQSTLRPDERDAVESAARRTEKRERRRIDRSDTAALIQNYIGRFAEILDRPDTKKRERGIEELKHILHDQVIIKPDAIPESYFASIIRRHREEGHGDIEIPETLRTELTATLIKDQTNSLDAWIDYLSSGDAKYPDALKYWAFRSILKMGKYDKEKKKFNNREGRGTVSPFPDLNREALAFVIDALEKKYSGKSVSFPNDITNDEQHAFGGFLEKEQFPQLYAWAIDHINPIPEDLLRETQGVWFTFPKGSDPMTYTPMALFRGKKVVGRPLVPSIESYATGWCLRGEGTAKRYLETSELQVFYSLDEEGVPCIPRVVTVKNDLGLAEVRGIAEQENLDAHIAPVVQEKLKEFPDGAAYTKKMNDMKHLTAIERATERNELLTKDDLLFLYEIDAPIEGFGYQRDPRIAELYAKRNPEEDMLVVFDCTKDQIARRSRDIRENTKAYVGPLQKGLFDRLPASLTHVYTSFPEGRIRFETLEIGGRTAAELKRLLDKEDAQGKKRFDVGDYAHSMMRNKQFVDPVDARHRERKGTLEKLDLVRLRVADLGFPNGATTKEVFARAKELGLELCPPETGPEKRLADTNQPLGDWYYIGMEPITTSDGGPDVFKLERSDDGLWLTSGWIFPDSQCFPHFEFVFRRRTSDAR